MTFFSPSRRTGHAWPNLRQLACRLAGVVALMSVPAWAGAGGADAPLSERHALTQALLDDHARAIGSAASLHEGLLRASSRGNAEAGVLRPLAELNEALDAMAGHASGFPGASSTRIANETLVMLRNLVPLFQNIDDDLRTGRPVSPALLARSFDAMRLLLARERELRRLADDERRAIDEAAESSHRRHAAWWLGLAPLLGVLAAGFAGLCVRLARQASQARREAAVAMQQAAAADELAAAAQRGKSKFLGMLSHELLTPLQSIVSSMDIIESKGRVDVGDPVFMRLREGARALRARMSDLVDFAKMSAGRLTVNPRKFRIDRLIEEVIAEHEEAVVRQDLDIHWHPDERLRQPIVTDPRRVRQILDNLVANAIKYTPRGGITIEAEVVPGPARLRLEVRDTGIGIAPDMLEHIFEPFYRVASASHLAEGSGLGLAVVRSLVDLLQGDIQVESTLGEGTRFAVEIPLGAAPTPAQPMAVAPGDRTVLIVDDAHDARTVIAGIVRDMGYQPAEAGSAGEALRALAERSYAVILLDIELPDQSGFEVIRQVRGGDGPNRDSFFVMLSASHEPDEAAALFNLRADKPIQAGQLRGLLQQAIA